MTPSVVAPVIEALDAHFGRIAVRDHVPGIAYGLMPARRPAHTGGVRAVRASGGPTPRGVLEEWDDAFADAPNVFLDEDHERRRAHLASIHARCGSLAPGGESVRSAASGVFRLKGECRDAVLSLMLSPEVPPRLVWYSLEAG